jgi:hypothetical protein
MALTSEHFAVDRYSWSMKKPFKDSSDEEYFQCFHRRRHCHCLPAIQCLIGNQATGIKCVLSEAGPFNSALFGGSF